MPRAQNGQTTSTPVTKHRDYAKLLDDETLRRDGLQLRLDRMEVELRRLLGGHQNANQVMQLLTRPGDGYAVLIGRASVMDAKIAQYAAGLAEQSKTTQTVSEIPVNPGDQSKDVEPDSGPAASNGKVAVAA